MLYNGLKKAKRDDYLSYISPENAFRKNKEFGLTSLKINQRNFNSNKTQERYKLEDLKDYHHPINNRIGTE